MTRDYLTEWSDTLAEQGECVDDAWAVESALDIQDELRAAEVLAEAEAQRQRVVSENPPHAA